MEIFFSAVFKERHNHGIRLRSNGSNTITDGTFTGGISTSRNIGCASAAYRTIPQTTASVGGESLNRLLVVVYKAVGVEHVAPAAAVCDLFRQCLQTFFLSGVLMTKWFPLSFLISARKTTGQRLSLCSAGRECWVAAH